MASPSVAPALLAALVAAADAAPDLEDVFVSYGKPSDGEAGDYLWLGVDDPDAEWMVLATSEREWEGVGIDADVKEGGAIPCVAMAWNGNYNGLQAAAETAFAIVETLLALVRANPNLGLPQVSWTLPASDLTVEYQPVDQGVQVRIPFVISYTALI